MRVEWSSTALADLNRFHSFLQDRYPLIASRVAEELRRRVRILSVFPMLGQSVHSEYREWIVPALNSEYVVRYRVEDDVVTIMRVFHGQEDREMEA